MIKLIFIFVVRFASSEPLKIEPHEICVQAFANNPNQTYYDLATGINCIPPGAEFRDLIWLNGFEGCSFGLRVYESVDFNWFDNELSETAHLYEVIASKYESPELLESS